MRRGSANGKFCALVQVSIDDAKNAEFQGSSLFDNFNDSSHICIKVRSYLRKLPLHMGAQCALAVDAKLLGYSTETGEYDVLDNREIRYQSGSTENNFNPQINAVSSNIYEAYFGPETIIRYLNDGDVGGDREIYLVIPRESLPSFELTDIAATLGTGGTSRYTVRANIQVDFVDGSSVPVIMEIKRNAVVTVDLSLDKLQIGNQAEDFMQFTPQLKPAYFTGNVSPSVIYSFTKYNTNNKAATQNPRISNAFGGNSTAMPFALPVFNVTNDNSSAFGLVNSITNGQSSNGRNYSGLRWVTGTSIPYSNGTSNNYTNDVVAYSNINLGQFFQMDRADDSEGLSASFAGTNNMSWGRKYGTANWFAANGSNGSSSPWITGTADSNISNGFGPSLGWHSVSAGSGAFYDVGPNGAGANHDPGTVFGPSTRTEMTAAFTQHGDMPSSQAMATSSSTNRQVERQFTHSNVNPVDSSLSDVKDSCIPLKDMKTNYFAQGFSIGGGAPIVVCARVVAAGCSAGNSINNRPDIVDSSVYWQHEKSNPNGTQIWGIPGQGDLDQQMARWANMTNYSVSSGSTTYIPGILTALATVEAQNNNAVYKYFTSNGGQSRTSPNLTTPKQFVNMPFNGFEYLCNKMFGNSGALHSLDTIPAHTEGYGGSQTFYDDDFLSKRVRSFFSAWTLKEAGAAYQNVGSGNGNAPFITGIAGGADDVAKPLYIGPASVVAGQVDNSYHWFIEGYQDVHFIVALGATSKNYSPPQVVDATVQSVDLCPWYSTDVYIAENGYSYGGSNGVGTGGFKVSQTDFNNGFSDSQFKLVTLYSKQKVPNGSGWQSDDATVAFRYPYASEHGQNLCKCTDPTLAQGIDNHLAIAFNDTIPTGFQGNFSSTGFGVNANNTVEQMFKNALPMDALYTGVSGKGAAGPGGAEPCVYATGNNDCLEFIGTDIFISDLDGGLNTNDDGEDGFGGLTVRASIRYRNTCSGSGVDNFKVGFTPQPTAIADILSIWKITYVPGNAGNESVSNPQFYEQATINQVLTEDDVISIEINPLGAGTQEYELLVHFQNTQNFMDATSEVQVFPDLPFVRSMPTFNQTYKFNGTTDQVTGVTAGDPTAITQDAFKSRFYNNEQTFDSGNSITGGSVRNKFVSSAHTDLNGAAETGASYIPYRSSKLVIEPMSATYAEEGKRVFDFVTYAKFRALTGCTDPGFLNFNPEALEDDGSCEGVSILGCTDENADNYDATATVDDGSCITCSQDLGPFSGFDNGSNNKFNASSVSAAVNNGSAANAYKILAGYSTDQTTLVGRFGETLGTQSLGLSGISGGTPSDLDTLGNLSILNQDNYPWFAALRKTGTIVGKTNLPLTNQQYNQAGTAIDADYELDIQVVFPSQVTADSVDNEGFNTFQSAIETPINHRLRIYAATDEIIDFITVNNSNDGTGAPTTPEGQQIFFIGEDSNGNPGFNSNTETSSLQAAGFSPTIVIDSAAQAFTMEGNDLSVARFHVQGIFAQTSTLLTNSTLYVIEHVLLDKSCLSFTSYPAFYSYTMIGLCGCTLDDNINYPTIHPWQINESNTYPVAYDNTPCASSAFPLQLGPGDSGQLCFTADSEITSCDSLYESCFLSVESKCLFDTVDSIDDSDLIQINGSFFVPQETTATILIEGIYNPTTNQYEYINQNTGFATQYLNYVINVYVDGELVPDLGQAGPSSNDSGDAIDSGGGWMHTFTFINATTYQFDVVYTNPADEGIYAGINLGVECVDTLGPQTVDRTDCEIFPGCTDEEANNFDPTATLDNGSCEYTSCEELFDSLAGGFDEINIVQTAATSSCEEEETIVLGQSVINTYVQFNTDGEVAVQVVTDESDDVFSTQCNIAICPANAVGFGTGISSTSELVSTILAQAENFETNGGQIPLGTSGQNAQISPLQTIDVPFAAGTATQFINRTTATETVANADQAGFTFTGLASGEYFVFVYPPQSNFTGSVDFTTEECINEILFYLDYVTRITVGSTVPDDPCEEDCGNPAGCDDEVYGCTDPDNTAYNEDATIDDGSCIPGTNCDDNPNDAACLDCSTEASELIVGSRRKSVTDTEDPCNPSNSGDGCTDPNACNYDPYIDASNSNNQLCDYCSCNEFSEDCCEGEDCGCDPQTDENCPPDIDPECPDPTNPSCNGGGIDPCYDPADCPPPVDPCVILGNCVDGPIVDPPIVEEPVIEIINPVSVPCEPDFLGLSPAATFDFSTVQSAIMRCQGTEGGKMVVKLKHGIEYDEEDLIKLDLITYLFIGGGDKVALPCLFNCNYETRTKKNTLEGKEAWARQGGNKWASTNSYTKGNIVVYYYNTYGTTKKSYFRATRGIEAGGIHPKYKDSGWKLIVDFKPKTVDPLGISDGTEKYLQVMYEFFVRYCSSCEVGGAAALLDPNTEGRDNSTGTSYGIKRNSNGGGSYNSGSSSIIGPDGEEIIF